MTELKEKKSYPLCWPGNYQRTAREKVERSRFSRSLTIASAVQELEREIYRLSHVSFQDYILSTNVRPTLRGGPSSTDGEPTDRGIAVYFKFRGKAVSLACDRWNRVAHNIWAVAKHIEALRGQERWGVGSIEQAFRGYMAIPERSEASSWWKVLDLPINATREQITAARDRLALIHHPDKGGTDEAMAAINLAYAEATKEMNGE